MWSKLGVGVLFAILVDAPVLGDDPSAARAPFLTVADYDERRDPFTDLGATIKRATSEAKRIVLVVGGNWCPWCKRLANLMESDPRLRDVLQKSFLVMKVADGGSNSIRFLGKYPSIDDYPHLYILAADGTLVHSQPANQFESNRGYDIPAIAQYFATQSATTQSATTQPLSKSR